MTVGNATKRAVAGAAEPPRATRGMADEQTSGRASSRRERLRVLMRQDILTAARQIMQEAGVQGLSMRALGKAVGVTAPTLYDYFASKEEVLDALYREGALLLREAMEAAIAATEPGRARLRAMGAAYRRFALANPDLYLLIFGRVDAAYRPGDEQLSCCLGVHDLVVEAHREAIARGELRPCDPEAMAFAAWAMAHGAISLEISGIAGKCGDLDPEQAYLASFDLLFEGTGSKPALTDS